MDNETVRKGANVVIVRTLDIGYPLCISSSQLCAALGS